MSRIWPGHKVCGQRIWAGHATHVHFTAPNTTALCERVTAHRHLDDGNTSSKREENKRHEKRKLRGEWRNWKKKERPIIRLQFSRLMQWEKLQHVLAALLRRHSKWLNACGTCKEFIAMTALLWAVGMQPNSHTEARQKFLQKPDYFKNKQTNKNTCLGPLGPGDQVLESPASFDFGHLKMRRFTFWNFEMKRTTWHKRNQQ